MKFLRGLFIFLGIISIILAPFTGITLVGALVCLGAAALFDYFIKSGERQRETNKLLEEQIRELKSARLSSEAEKIQTSYENGNINEEEAIILLNKLKSST